MQRSELTTRTGIYPDSTLYHVIEREYERQTEDGHDVWKDKDEFCAAYLANKDGLAERIQRETDEVIWRKEEAHRKAMTENSALVQKLNDEIERLKKALDTEREWTPCTSAGTQLTQEKYEEMDANATKLDRLDDAEAAQLLSEMFGFMPERIAVLHTVSTFERDRHGRLRVAQTFKRDSLCISSDWSYIRFDCAGCQWELIDGELVPYED